MRALFAGLVFLFVSEPLFASTNPDSSLAPIRSEIRTKIRKDLEKRHRLSFGSLLAQWQTRYGTKAVSPLLELAALSSLEDSQRYTALMGAARLGGSASAPLLTPFLKDNSWMLRAGCLRAITALKNPETAKAPLSLLRDPALVVRLEAVESIDRLRPQGSLDALIQAIADPMNYHARHAQWIPERALKVIASMGGGKTTAQKLSTIRARIPDASFVKKLDQVVLSLSKS